MGNEEKAKQVKTLYTKIAKHWVDSSFSFLDCGRTDRYILDCTKELTKIRGGVLTKELMTDYCVFQVYYWRNYRESNINWTVAHSFGKNAIKRFVERKKGFGYYEDLWLKEKKTRRDDLWVWCFGLDKHVYANMIFLPAEEGTKYRLHNTEYGYVICERSTTLWSPLSPACSECVNMTRCMRRTASLYPELYRVRLESNN